MQLGLVNQSVVNGVKREFEAVGDAEFVEDIVQMVLNGLFGDEKFFTDFLVAEALGDELDDFLFAVAEQRLFAARAGFGGLGESFHDFGGHTIVEPDFSGVDTMNALHQEIGCRLLEDHTSRAKSHRSNNVAVILGCG